MDSTATGKHFCHLAGLQIVHTIVQHYSAYTLLEAQPIRQNVQHLGLVWDNENQSHENNTIMLAECHGGRHCLKL